MLFGNFKENITSKHNVRGNKQRFCRLTEVREYNIYSLSIRAVFLGFYCTHFNIIVEKREILVCSLEAASF
jgi:hypothetical protein